VLGHFRLKGGLQHGAGDLAEQPSRTDQRHTLRPGLIDQLLRNPHVQPRRGLPFGGPEVLACGVLVRQQ
jgi:hypothetical protein